MALKKPTTNSSTPAFEGETVDQETGEVAVAERPVEGTAAVADEAKAATTTVIATASRASVATLNDAAAKAKAFQRELEDMRAASDFSFGNYASFKAINGSITGMNSDKDDLGRWCKVRMIAWDDHFQVSPGTDDTKSKDFVAYSKDGETIDSVIGEDLKRFVGKPVNEYLQYLNDEEGFDRASVRRFVDTACALLASDSGDGPINTVISVILSESSITAFNKYQQSLKDAAKCVAMGLPGFTLPDDPFTFFFIREAAEKGNKKWTKLKISSSLPAKI